MKDRFAGCAVCPFPLVMQLKLRINQPERQKCPCRGVPWGFSLNPARRALDKRIIPSGFEITLGRKVLRVLNEVEVRKPR